MSNLRAAWAIAARDLSAEVRSRELLTAMAVFSLLAVLVFSLALDLRGAQARLAAPGVLWATIVFAGVLGLSRSVAREQNNHALDALLLAPADRSVVFFGKAAANLIVISVVELGLVPTVALLFDPRLLRPSVLVVLGLGTIGYAATGTLLALVSASTRAREVMLPVLLIPLLVPVLLAGVRATAWLADGGALGEVGHWLRLLAVYDLLALGVPLLTFGAVVQE